MVLCGKYCRCQKTFEGDEIAVIKNDNDWKLSLKNMLAGNLKYDKADSEKTAGQSVF